MWQGTVQIGGAQVPVVANVASAQSRDFVVLTLTASQGDFSYTKSFNIRGGVIPQAVIAEFKSGALEAYQGREATIQFLLGAGFVRVTPAVNQ